MNLTIVIYPKCNLGCSFCFYNNQNAEMKFITLDNLKYFLNYHNLKYQSITLTGGEPTMHPDIINIIIFLKKYCEKLIILTNASYLNEQLISCFQENNIILTISLDSVYIDYHQKYRGGMKQTINNIKKLRNLDIVVNIHSTISSKNYGDLENIIRFCNEYKCNLDISPISVKNSDPLSILNLNNTEKEILLILIKKWALQKNKIYYYKLFYFYLINHAVPNLSVCPFISKNIVISSTGKIYRCFIDMNSLENSLGSIFDSSFSFETALKYKKCISCFKLDCYGVF